MPPVSGDFQRLRSIIGGLQRLQGGRVTRLAIKACAQTALELTQEGFERAQDPYGAQWAPLRRRQGQPLRDTGRLYASLNTSASGTSFSLGSNVAYASFHQDGTQRIPRRPFFPDDRGLPPGWGEEFAKAVEEVIEGEVPR